MNQDIQIFINIQHNTDFFWAYCYEKITQAKNSFKLKENLISLKCANFGSSVYSGLKSS